MDLIEEKEDKKIRNSEYMKGYMQKCAHYKCSCGAIFKTYHKYLHIKTKRHLKYIVNNPNPEYKKINVNIEIKEIEETSNE